MTADFSRQIALLASPGGLTDAGARHQPAHSASVLIGAPLRTLTASCRVVGPTGPIEVVFFATAGTTDETVCGASDNTEEASNASGVTAHNVRDFKSRSGLTWEQLGRLFGVSRRAVHGWAAGARMNAAHSEMLARLRLVMADVDTRGANATEARSLLLDTL